ncbi:MAG: hypothetical protein V1754_10860 [Pseudomonadota bacterium]
MKRKFFLVCALASLGGCFFDPDFDGKEFPCNADKECPDGLECTEGICRQEKDQEPQCATDGDCPAKYKCKEEKCQFVGNNNSIGSIGGKVRLGDLVFCSNGNDLLDCHGDLRIGLFDCAEFDNCPDSIKDLFLEGVNLSDHGTVYYEFLDLEPKRYFLWAVLCETTDCNENGPGPYDPVNNFPEEVDVTQVEKVTQHDLVLTRVPMR